MSRFKFCMEDGHNVDIIARDFRTACMLFDQFRLDPRQIASIECR